MSDTIVRVENLGKQYHLGAVVGYKTLRDSIANMATAPFRRKGQPRRDPHELLWALKDISFEVKRGEVIGIIGGNGAGKSTLLKILSRITSPTEGLVEIKGRVGSLLEVGTGFHPELTGKENIYLNGAILGMKKAEVDRKFKDIIEFSGVEKFLDTPVKHYSSGMYVRLAFAVAAHLETEILIVDEVLAVGDAAFQKKCLGKMNEAASGGRTVLFVSHNMPAVKSLCPRAILLKDGHIELDDNTAEVAQRYLGTAGETTSRVTWPVEKRPGNRSFKLNSITLKNHEGAQSSSIEISKGGVFEIEFEVVEDGAQAGFSIVVFDSEGNCLFSSLSNTEPAYYGKPMPRGRYVASCRLPGHMLNSGTFVVSLICFGGNWSDPFRVDNLFSFAGNDDGVLSRDYHGYYGGVFRPELQWNTRLVNA